MLGIFRDVSRVLNADVNDLLFHREKIFQHSEDGNGNDGINSPEAKKAIARRYYQEIMNEAKLDVIDELMSPNFIFTIPTHPEPYHGPDGFKNLVTMLHGAFPDVHLKVEHLLVDGDTIVGHWTGSGTHTGGPLHTVKGDIPASGKGFVIDGVSWLKIVDGKIVESLANEDTLSLLQQIGVIPTVSNPSISEESRTIAERYFTEVMNQGNLDLIAELLAPDVKVHMPAMPHPIRGQEALKHLIVQWRDAFPDLCYTAERQAGDQNMAAVRWTMSATHKGDYLHFAATGNRIQFQGVTICRLQDGQIAEMWFNQNDLGLVEQISAAAIPA